MSVVVLYRNVGETTWSFTAPYTEEHYEWGYFLVDSCMGENVYYKMEVTNRKVKVEEDEQA